MPTFVLIARAELEGCAKFWVPEGHVWHFDLKQAAGPETREGVEVDPDEEEEVPNAKGATANLLLKFPGDKHASYMKFVPMPALTRAQTAGDTEMVPIAVFECRGMEPIHWTPTGPYCVESEAGVVYDEVGFKDDEDWCDYDEKSGASLMVSKAIAHEFVTMAEAERRVKRMQQQQQQQQKEKD
jgi:hypothetical protein